MFKTLTRHLEQFGQLSAEEKQALSGLVKRVINLVPDQNLLESQPIDGHLILSGFACSSRILKDGGRQIVSLHLPGDICGLESVLIGRLDYSISTLTSCTVAVISRERILDLTQAHPHLAHTLWRTMLIESSILRERIVSLGQRSAASRMAHLLCELALRLKVAGLAKDNSFDLPITQAQIGDALGVSNVHINRVLQELRRKNLLTLKGGTVTIHDWHGLAEKGEFDPSYLYLPQTSNSAISLNPARTDRSSPQPQSSITQLETLRDENRAYAA